MTPLTVASVRLVARDAPTFDAWWSDVEAPVRDAAAAGARLVCLPEYVCKGLLGTLPVAALRRPGREVFDAAFAPHRDAWAERAAALAEELGIWLLAGTFWSGANEALLCGPAGELLLQPKLHPVPVEVELGMAPGASLETIAVDGVETAILTCFDIEFPELARALVERGVELILCPSLTSSPQGAGRVEACARARGVEDQCFVVVTPLAGSVAAGTPAAATGYGDPFACGPIDPLFPEPTGILARAAPGAPRAVAALDVARLRAARDAAGPMPILALRRPELYPTLRAPEVRT